MMINTCIGVDIPETLIGNYFASLVNLFFKILPIREGEEKMPESLITYMKSLQLEILGCNRIIIDSDNDSAFLRLVSILQYLIDNPDVPIKDTKREVFKAISICNKARDRHSGGEVRK